MRIYEASLNLSATAGTKYWTGFLKSNDEASNPHDIFTVPATLNTSCVTFQKNGVTFDFNKESCQEIAGYICQKGNNTQ